MKLLSKLYNNEILRRIYRSRVGRFFYHIFADMHYYATNRNPLVPPPHIRYIGRGDYEAIGNAFFGYFQEYCALTPQSKILDIGCGTGRMALPFTEYLTQEGEYCGFDIVKTGIDWCTTKISAQYPNFTFKHIGLNSTLYNTSAQEVSTEFVFPYDDSSFDLVFLTSVFTHMDPDSIENYLKEISRVLNRGGYLLFTASILNEFSLQQIIEKKSVLDFRYKKGVHRTVQADNYDDICIDEEWLRSTISSVGLTIVEPIRYGAWSGRTDGFDGQDIVICTKE